MTVEIYAHMPRSRRGGPDARDGSRTLDVGQNEGVSLGADVVYPVPVGIPIQVFANSGIILTAPVITGGQGSPFADRRQRGQSAHARHPFNQLWIGVGLRQDLRQRRSKAENGKQLK